MNEHYHLNIVQLQNRHGWCLKPKSPLSILRSRGINCWHHHWYLNVEGGLRLQFATWGLNNLLRLRVTISSRLYEMRTNDNHLTLVCGPSRPSGQAPPAKCQRCSC